MSVTTIRGYCKPGESNLERGIDYLVRRITRGAYLRRKLFVTERGLQRLQMRAYRVYTREGGLARQERTQAFITKTATGWPAPRVRKSTDRFIAIHPRSAGCD